jgi:NAD(P)-dependent dehydrogenase (short-subunit alcohol dehydrogenase family)
MGDRLKDKVAIITGAGSIGPGWGNGKAAAVAMAREGAKIFAIDLNPDAAVETKGIIEGEGGTCATFTADVSSSGDVADAVEACISAFGRIDILHNNVGIVEPGGPVEIGENAWDRLIDINVKSIYLMCRHVLPLMEAQGGGAIVNVSSIASFFSLGYPCVSYSASKGAINAMNRNIAIQYAGKGIRCNAILPGLMDTPLIRGAVADAYDDIDAMLKKRDAQCPMGFMGDAWDTANAAVFLASDEARYITGIELVVDGGLTVANGPMG